MLGLAWIRLGSVRLVPIQDDFGSGSDRVRFVGYPVSVLIRVLNPPPLVVDLAVNKGGV